MYTCVYIHIYTCIREYVHLGTACTNAHVCVNVLEIENTCINYITHKTKYALKQDGSSLISNCKKVLKNE